MLNFLNLLVHQRCDLLQVDVFLFEKLLFGEVLIQALFHPRQQLNQFLVLALAQLPLLNNLLLLWNKVFNLGFKSTLHPVPLHLHLPDLLSHHLAHFLLFLRQLRVLLVLVLQLSCLMFFKSKHFCKLSYTFMNPVHSVGDLRTRRLIKGLISAHWKLEQSGHLLQICLQKRILFSQRILSICWICAKTISHFEI